MRSMKFAAYPIRRLQPSTFVNTFTPDPTGVTLNSFAAFAAPVSDMDRYDVNGDIYTSIQNTYGTGVADQVTNAAAAGDRGMISQILGSAIPLGKPGGGSVQPQLDTSTSDAFWTQIYNEPLVAPIEAANRVLTSTGKSLASSSGITGTITLVGVGLLVWFVLAHNK